MNKLFKLIETSLDNFKIKKKLVLLYIFCVLVPLCITDTLIINMVINSVKSVKYHEMENIANTVKYNFINSINNVDSVAKSMYMNQSIDSFLEKEYKNSFDYVSSYQSFFNNFLFDNGISTNKVSITFYTDNETIIQGGKLQSIQKIQDSDWYQSFLELGEEKALYMIYDTNKVNYRRRIMFVQKMNFFSMSKYNKIITVDLDYGETTRNLNKMNFNSPVYVCYGDKILMSNRDNNSISREFETYVPDDNSLQTSMNLYGTSLSIYVHETPVEFSQTLYANFPIIILMILINIILPVIFAWGFNRSFTTRLHELSTVFNKVDEERLSEISKVRGKDEIGKLMSNYNKMVRRINDLIQTVYISKMKEQEMTVARKNAELLALQSQINPHFLFNALESIRMHSVLKMEYETAEMVHSLAVLQRQYLEWNEDNVEIEREIEFVKYYLDLQKYRFGDRLSYELKVDEICKAYRIPKLTIATFVENACIHGIESKTTPGWIFVRIFREEEYLVIEVEDTGNGMDEEYMQQLISQMRNANIDMLKEKGRVGIINACLRLNLFTNGKAKFELEGEKGIGIIIQMKIPLIYVEQMV